MWNRNRVSRRAPRRTNGKLRRLPGLETMEPRVVLSGTGLLQGTVFADNAGTGQYNPTANNTPLAGAVVSLYQANTLVQSVTTGTSGNYVFTGLAPGDYTLVETPPSGYANEGTQINSPLTSTLGTTSNSINVEVYDLSSVAISYDSGSYQSPSTTTGTFGRDPGAVNYTLYGSASATTEGQVPIVASVTNGPTTSEFSTECININQSLNFSPDSFDVSAGTTSTSSDLSNGNAGAIAFLYNTYGALVPTTSSNPPITGLQAFDQQALQLAIWKLEYDTGANLQSFSSGNFQLTSFYDAQGLDNNPLNEPTEAVAFTVLETQALAYVSQALNYSENALALTSIVGSQSPATPGAGYQDLIAPEALNFSNVTAATISGEVYNDTNDNSVLNTGEVGITGGSVTLTGTNASGTITPITEPIASNGTYSFTGLLPGSYTVTETTLPTGFVPSGSDTGTVSSLLIVPTQDGSSSTSTVLSSINVIGGQSAINENFGVYTPGTISGEVYNDANADGALDNGESGLAGETVTLTGTTAAGAITPIVEQVASNGTYSFTGLLPGTYTVTESNIPTGYTPTASNVGTVGGTADGTSTSSTVLSSISISGGQNAINEDFGDILLSCCSLPVYQFGVYNPATGVTSVVPTLQGNTQEGDTVTAYFVIPAGHYEQVALTAYNAPEPFFVAANFPLQTVYAQTSGIYGPGVWALPSVTLPKNFYQIDFSCPGTTNYSYDIGGTNPQGSAPLSITGEVYYDTNANGSLDAGETGVAGDTVTLTGTDAYGTAVSYTTTTNAQGVYSFSGFPFSSASGYTVTASVPTGTFAGSATVGQVSGSSAGVLGSTVETVKSIVLASSSQTTGTGYNFGVTTPDTISGEVYNDANADGALDSGESGLAGETVTLTGSTAAGAITPIVKQVASNGTYSFTGLMPGTYTVTESNIPTGYTATASNVGTVGGTADGTSTSSTVLSSIKVTSGQSAINEDFGDILLSCCNLPQYQFAVYNPATGVTSVVPNLQGNTQEGDVVTAYFVIPAGHYEQLSLTTYNAPEPFFIAANLPLQTVYSASSGIYGPGVWALPSVTIPQNFYQIDFSCPGTTNYSFDIGGTNPQGSAALSITGEVYNDLNLNGSLDSSEPGVAGATVTLTGTDAYGSSVSYTTTTNAQGVYSFSGFPFSNASGYTVTATVPSGDFGGGSAVGKVSGTTDGTVGSEKVTNIVLATSSQTTGTGYNFGISLPDTISGEVYNDANADGVLDNGETGLSGVVVTAVGQTVIGTTVSYSQTVGSSGTFSFSGLIPGTYTLTESNIPSGYTSVASNVGTVAGVADGTSTSSTVLSSIKVVSGQTAVNEDFGDIILSCCNLSQYQFAVYNPATGVTSVVPTLQGNTQEGDTVTAYFVIPAGHYEQLSLTAYNAPEPFFVAANFPLQTVYAQTSGIYGPGVWALPSVTLPKNFYQIDFSCPGTTNYSYDIGGTNPQGSAELSVTGEVYNDLSGSGTLQTSDTGASGVTVTLAGTDAYGSAVSYTTTTNASGVYSFAGMPFSNASGYTVTVAVPSGLVAGKATVGTVSGSSDGALSTTSEAVTTIKMTSASQTTGTGYNFGLETTVTAGQVKSCSFWTSLQGQTLINSLNGGFLSTSLGTWLAKLCPNTFGSLANQTNSQVWLYLDNLSSWSWMSAYDGAAEQLLATCLSAYVSNSSLAGSAGVSYGFTVTQYGMSNSCYNVGSSGSAMGMANNTSINVMSLITACDAKLAGGSCSSTVTSAASTIFGGICSI